MRLTYSIADQNWRQTRSIGIFNFSVGMLGSLAGCTDMTSIRLLANSTLKDVLPSSDRILTSFHDSAIRSRIGRILWDQFGAYHHAGKSADDWLFLPKGFASLILRPPVKLAAYVHDVIPLVYPERYPGWISRAEFMYWELTYRATLKNARVIFTNTKASKDELERWAMKSGLQCPPIVVAGYGFVPSRVPSVMHKKSQILIELRVAPHKRSDLAVEYVERWRKETSFDGTIICIGSLPEELSLPVSPAWRFEGRVHPDKCRQLMEESLVTVFFSEYEGFGMPPVESVLSGACPVYSDIAPTREVMQSIGCSFRNDSYKSFAEAMNKALKIPGEELAECQNSLLSRYNWNNVSGTIIDTLKQLA